MAAGSRLIRGIDGAVGEDSGLHPVVHALPDTPAQFDGRVEEDLLPPAALLGGGRAQRAHGGDRRHDRVADQFGTAAEPAGVVTEPTRVAVERTLLLSRQAQRPGRGPGDPRLRHAGESAQAGRSPAR